MPGRTSLRLTPDFYWRTGKKSGSLTLWTGKGGGPTPNMVEALNDT